MIFQTWEGLNKALMNTEDEAILAQILTDELALTAPRKMFALRIHSRLNKVRGERERMSIMRRLGL